MKNKIVTLILIIIFGSLGYAQNKISLLDLENVKEYLELTAEQVDIITPKIKQIITLQEEDEKIIGDIKERVKNNDEPGFFEKIGIKRGHDKRAAQIKDLVDEIEERLNDKQKIQYNEIEKPKLKALKKEDVFGK